MIFGCASVGWGAPQQYALTTLQAIRGLSDAEADKALPVAFEATVTYYRDYENTLFVEDGGAEIFLWAAKSPALVPGDRILVRGVTHRSFRPEVDCREIVFLHHGARPQPVPATFDQLIRSQLDCTLVTVRAMVRAVDPEKRMSIRDPKSPAITSTAMQLLTESGSMEAVIDSDDASAHANLLDAEVEITGVAGGIFDGKMQLIGIVLHVSSLADVKVLKRATVSSRALPVTPMDQVLSSYRVNDLTQRVHVQGTITYYEPLRAVVLQSGSKSLWIGTYTTASDLRLGDLADATGFPDSHNGFLTLTNGEIWDSGVPVYVPPQPATWNKLAASGYIFDLVSIEGQVVTEVREHLQDEYVLSSDGQLFTAILRHASSSNAPMKLIPQGARIRVTGICILENSNPFLGKVPFEIMLRSPDEILIVAKPPLLNVRNLIAVLSIMLLGMIAVSAWGWMLHAKVRRQTGTLAKLTQIEKRRSRILEDINSSRPLAEILEETAEKISFMLDDAPCWFEIKDGARLGHYPPDIEQMRVVSENIPARSGPPLGQLFAAFPAGTQPAAAEKQTLIVGTHLAALAMETRRLYSDLRRRSEFDLLTDIPNRFAMERFMELRIEEAHISGATLGLIYIDLDRFKPINDSFGHHVGDLFLQEVAMRMSRQLLGGDMLARLGGDEFAAMVTLQHGRTDLYIILARLEHCFDEPFLIEGHLLQGSASLGVALYPHDGTTKDSLLSAADAAMYAVKNERRHAGKMPV
jgi:diguanylate cyclase (GGDEF)-like protein